MKNKTKIIIGSIFIVWLIILIICLSFSFPYNGYGLSPILIFVIVNSAIVLGSIMFYVYKLVIKIIAKNREKGIEEEEEKEEEIEYSKERFIVVFKDKEILNLLIKDDKKNILQDFEDKVNENSTCFKIWDGDKIIATIKTDLIKCIYQEIEEESI